MYEAIEGRPVTNIDILTHHFMNLCLQMKKILKALAKDMGITVEEVKAKCDALHEFNPMMGHRGCRLSVTYPEIARMQTRAVMEAAIRSIKGERLHYHS